MLGVVLTFFVVMTVVGAALTGGRAQGPLSLGDVAVPAAIPLLLVLATTLACRNGFRRPK
jgi:hypothetical protein